MWLISTLHLHNTQPRRSVKIIYGDDGSRTVEIYKTVF